jgi:NAD(P)H-dependent FMN reductase
MEHTLKLKIILGSTREGRFSEIAGAWAKALAEKDPSVAAEVVDLREFKMPFFDQAVTPSSKKEPYANPEVQKWTAQIADGDAFIIIAPEYNRGVPGVLKNAIDWVFGEWHKKPVGYVGYGTTGGSRSVDSLRTSAVELQMVPVRTAVHIPGHWTLRDETGALKPGSLDQYAHAFDTMLGQIKEWGNASRSMRSGA